MAASTDPQPALVLLVTGNDPALARAIHGEGAVVARAPNGQFAVDIARETNPDVIVIDANLPDMPGLDACRLLRADPVIGRMVPILIAVRDQPSPGERVDALRAGVWDFVRLVDDPAEAALKIRAYTHARRSISEQTGTSGLLEPETGLHTGAGLARCAQEIGALMVRLREAFACVVVEWDQAPTGADAAVIIARAARSSDVVGKLSATRCGILAPATNHAGAVRLATRVAGAVRHELDVHANALGLTQTSPRLLIGYDAVANAGYAPFNPMSLIAHASQALSAGTPEPEYLWVRRHEPATPAGISSIKPGSTLS
jgi:CheY-like chemotaxis protein